MSKLAKSKSVTSRINLTVLISILVLTIVISGCSTINANSGTKKYRTGYNSLDMTFASGSPPDSFNYDSNCQNYGDCQNEIPIVVQIKNTGASDAYGMLYISGYDPNIISIAGDGAYMPRGNAFTNFYFNNNGFGFQFGGPNYYIGYQQQGQGTASAFSVLHNNQNINYGMGSFGQNGEYYHLNVAIDNSQNRIGYSAGELFFKNYITGGMCANNLVCGFRTVFAIEGDTEQTPGGGIEVYDFPAYIFGLPESLEVFQQPIMVTACYTYATRTTTMMCIDPRPNSNAHKVCTPTGVSLSGGQGGPISIITVEQQAGNQKTVFTIHVKHTKKGTYDQVYDWYSLAKCNPNSGLLLKATDLNVVYIDHVDLSGIPLDCSQRDANGLYRVRLDDSGNGQITCTAYLNAATTLTGGAYEAPLTIDFAYGYSKSIQKVINIRKI